MLGRRFKRRANVLAAFFNGLWRRGLEEKEGVLSNVCGHRMAKIGVEFMVAV